MKTVARNNYQTKNIQELEGLLKQELRSTKTAQNGKTDLVERLNIWNSDKRTVSMKKEDLIKMFEFEDTAADAFRDFTKNMNVVKIYCLINKQQSLSFQELLRKHGNVDSTESKPELNVQRAHAALIFLNDSVKTAETEILRAIGKKKLTLGFWNKMKVVFKQQLMSTLIMLEPHQMVTQL